MNKSMRSSINRCNLVRKRTRKRRLSRNKKMTTNMSYKHKLMKEAINKAKHQVKMQNRRTQHKL